MIRFFTLALISSTILLTGCSYINKGKNVIMPNKGDVYLQSAETPPLQMPAGIPADSVGDAYPIPPVAGTVSKKRPSLLPPNSLADQIAQGKISPDVLKQKITKPTTEQKKL